MFNESSVEPLSATYTLKEAPCEAKTEARHSSVSGALFQLRIMTEQSSGVDDMGASWDKELGIIARADKGTAVHESNPQLQTKILIALKLFGRDEFFHAQFGSARLEILPNGDHIASR